MFWKLVYFDVDKIGILKMWDNPAIYFHEKHQSL